MNVCECMYTQNSIGQAVCKQCFGDIYACECPLIHSVKCDNKENNKQ
jgi:hypothetical protein